MSEEHPNHEDEPMHHIINQILQLHRSTYLQTRYILALFELRDLGFELSYMDETYFGVDNEYHKYDDLAEI